MQSNKYLQFYVNNEEYILEKSKLIRYGFFKEKIENNIRDEIKINFEIKNNLVEIAHTIRNFEIHNLDIDDILQIYKYFEFLNPDDFDQIKERIALHYNIKEKKDFTKIINLENNKMKFHLLKKFFNECKEFIKITYRLCFKEPMILKQNIEIKGITEQNLNYATYVTKKYLCDYGIDLNPLFFEAGKNKSITLYLKISNWQKHLHLCEYGSGHNIIEYLNEFIIEYYCEKKN